MIEFLRKLIHLPGTKLTPEVVLHRALQKLDRIKAVVIVIQWNDDSMDCDWSQMRVSELCMASRALDRSVDATAFDGENIFKPRPPAA